MEKKNELISKAVYLVNLTIIKRYKVFNKSPYAADVVAISKLVNAWCQDLILKSNEENFEDFLYEMVEIAKTEMDYLNRNTSFNSILLIRRKEKHK